MGIENQEFARAAEKLRAVHDGAATDGSPIGAVADQIMEDTVAASNGNTTVRDVLWSAIARSIEQSEKHRAEMAKRELAEDELQRLNDDVDQFFAVAQIIDSLANTVTAVADMLEIGGMRDIVPFIRRAVVSVRAGSDIARHRACVALDLVEKKVA